MALRSQLSNYGAWGRPKPKAKARPKPPRIPTTGRPQSGNWGKRAPVVKAPARPVAAGATAPAGPARLAPLPPSGLPVDPSYDATVASLARRRDDALAGLTQQRTASFGEYGYKPTLDAAGGVQSLSFDPSNPYSRAALLKKNYEQSKAGNTTGMAARGQLYSGALGTMQDQADQGFGQNTDNLQKQLIGFLARNMSQQTQAKTGYEEGVGQAAADRLGRAADSSSYDPEALAALQAQIDSFNSAIPAAGSAATKKKPAAKKKPAKKKPEPKRPAPRQIKPRKPPPRRKFGR